MLFRSSFAAFVLRFGLLPQAAPGRYERELRSWKCGFAERSAPYAGRAAVGESIMP